LSTGQPDFFRYKGFVATTRTSGEKRGEVLAVLRELLDEGRGDDVLAIVTKLVA
jgi:hypothetical protein